MSFKKFIKDKLLIISLILISILSVEILLLAYKIVILVRVYVFIAPVLCLVIALLIEYYNKEKFYNNIKEKLNELEQKFLISEVVTYPNFEEGKILKDILQDTGKSMLENVNKYKYLQEDYKEYIELWIHEIKLPIASR